MIKNSLLISRHSHLWIFSLLMGVVAFPATLLADTAEEALQRAEEAIQAYDFSRAAKEVAAARKLDKAGDFAADADDAEARAEMGQRLLQHVEKIVVLDSITVPADRFFETYRLPLSVGKILAPEAIPIQEVQDLASMAYSNQAEDFMIWSQPDSLGTLRIVEASRLTDGSWGEPRFTPEFLNDGGDADFPFLSADGSMLYYAADGEESLGGYDIFVASRDTGDGSYLAPRNLGMPFNSPADDYMLVNDEENGVGWWATDRNHIPDHVTIYLYLLPRERDNIGEDEDPVAAARIPDYKATWPDQADYDELLSKIRTLSADAESIPDFQLPMPGGKKYTKYEDFHNPEAQRLMKEYEDLLATQESDLETLARLRRKFAADRTDRSLTTRILALEETTETRQRELEKRLSEIYRLER